jgi:hypothetical protein
MIAQQAFHTAQSQKLASDPFTFRHDDARQTWKMMKESAVIKKPFGAAVHLPESKDLSFCADLAAQVEEIMPHCSSISPSAGFNEAMNISYMNLVKKQANSAPPSITTLAAFLGNTWVHGDKLKQWCGHSPSAQNNPGMLPA